MLDICVDINSASFTEAEKTVIFPPFASSRMMKGH